MLSPLHGLMGPVGLSHVPKHSSSGTGLSCAARPVQWCRPRSWAQVGYPQKIQEHSVHWQFWVCDCTVGTPCPVEAAPSACGCLLGSDHISRLMGSLSVLGQYPFLLLPMGCHGVHLCLHCLTESDFELLHNALSSNFFTALRPTVNMNISKKGQ